MEKKKHKRFIKFRTSDIFRQRSSKPGASCRTSRTTFWWSSWPMEGGDCSCCSFTSHSCLSHSAHSAANSLSVCQPAQEEECDWVWVCELAGSHSCFLPRLSRKAGSPEGGRLMSALWFLQTELKNWTEDSVCLPGSIRVSPLAGRLWFQGLSPGSGTELQEVLDKIKVQIIFFEASSFNDTVVSKENQCLYLDWMR